ERQRPETEHLVGRDVAERVSAEREAAGRGAAAVVVSTPRDRCGTDSGTSGGAGVVAQDGLVRAGPEEGPGEHGSAERAGDRSGVARGGGSGRRHEKQRGHNRDDADAHQPGTPHVLHLSACVAWNGSISYPARYPLSILVCAAGTGLGRSVARSPVRPPAVGSVRSSNPSLRNGAAVLRQLRVEGALRGHLRSGALDVSNVSVTCEREVLYATPERGPSHGGRSSGARCGCVIRGRLLARSETTLPRRRRPRWLARRAHRPVRDVRRRWPPPRQPSCEGP